jgi:uracil phosphoribosyltransferase
MSGINLPKNAHVSTHPCLQAKLSQLRSASTGSKDAQTLVHELALMVGYEALAAGLKAHQAGTVGPSHSIPSHHIYIYPVPSHHKVGWYSETHAS